MNANWKRCDDWLDGRSGRDMQIFLCVVLVFLAKDAFFHANSWGCPVGVSINNCFFRSAAVGGGKA